MLGQLIRVLAIAVFAAVFQSAGAAADDSCSANSSGTCGADSARTSPDARAGFGLFPFGFHNAPSSGTAPSPASSAAKIKTAPPVQPAAGGPEVVLFYAWDCPHCHQAMEWLSGLGARYPGLKVSKYEIKRSAENRELFAGYLAGHKAGPAGVPAFFIGGRLLVGFVRGQSEAGLLAALDEASGKTAQQSAQEIAVPFIGSINPAAVSMPQFSFVLGLLDGLNPCAMWVLVMLMSLLIHTQSPRKMLMVGGIFVAASAVVYFAFMAAWFNLFLVIGGSRWITAFLGSIAVAMGLVNIKEVFFFKQGVSLMIPESAKPTLMARMRLIINERNTAVAVAATIVLALFVNLVELGCTIGLPAIFTRVLSVKQTGFAAKYFYMGIYNIAYVIPLAAIVGAFVFTLGRFRMTETHAKVLKAVSGILMLLLGLLMVLRPDALVMM
ncbi:MAG: hypothetical protein WC421_09440 [Elusimicrobiales bacterium]